MKLSTFIEDGIFFKGNTHMHSTVSDGSLTPDNLKKLYKDNGFNFIAITDHNIFSNYDYFNEKDFIMIPGVEVDTFKDNKYNHIIGLGTEKTKFKHMQKITRKGTENIQELIDMLTVNGNLAIIAHPSWSNLDLNDVFSAKNCLGFEIFNNLSEQRWANGECSVYFENVCRSGGYCYCFASDDLHDSTAAQMGSFISVKAEKLTAQSILSSIQKGSFYASTGPVIKDFYYENGRAYVSCSPAEQINIVTDVLFKEYHAHANGKILIDFSAETSGVRLVRAIVIDKFGKKAYTQPIIL